MFREVEMLSVSIQVASFIIICNDIDGKLNV